MLQRSLRAIKEHGEGSSTTTTVRSYVEEAVVCEANARIDVSLITPTNNTQSLAIWTMANGDDYAGGDTLTIKLYKQHGGKDYLVETTTVTTPAVTDGTAVKTDVSINGSLPEYETVKVTGSVGGTSSMTVTVLLGKSTLL